MPGERLSAALREGGDLPAVIPYVTSGYPTLDDTVGLLLALQRAGCAAAEIGIAFSDPLADGPTIQRAGVQALRNGATAALAIEQAAEARRQGVTIPLVLMTYVNPILSLGMARFCAASAAAGVDGLIVPDLPGDEAGELRTAAAHSGLALVPLVAPTTTDARLADAAEHASGFIYCVSVTGITGARSALGEHALELLDRVRAVSPLPRALGFGLSRHEHLLALRGRCEAAVVASALIDAIAARPEEPAAAAVDFIRTMTNAS